MAYTFRSASTASDTNDLSKNIVVTKPTGLTVGDLMIAVGVAIDGTLSGPEGWTAPTVTNGVSSMKIWYKVAEAADVAAANFTFTNSGGTNDGAVGMAVFYNINVNQIFWSASYDANAPAQNVTFTNAIDTVLGDSLIILAISTSDDGSDVLSSYSIANDNPSWTSFCANNYNSGTSVRKLNCFYSVRTTTNSSTGNISAGFAEEISFPRCLIASFPESKAVTQTDTVTMTDALTKEIKVFYSDLTSVSDAISMVEDKWTEGSKNSASWTDDNKNASSWTDTSKNSSSWTNTSK